MFYKVQEDLQQLKDEIDLLKLSGNSSVNFKPIDDALKRTKTGIQVINICFTRFKHV